MELKGSMFRIIASSLIILTVVCGGVLLYNLWHKSISDITFTTTDSHGTLWAASKNGLLRKNGNGYMELVPLPSLTHHAFPGIYALANDSARQYLWIGAWNHLYCYDLSSERFITISDSIIHNITHLSIDKCGNVLAKCEHGLFRYVYDKTPLNGIAEQMNTTHYAKNTVTDLPTLYYKPNNGIRRTANIIIISIFVIILIIIVMIKRERLLVIIKNAVPLPPAYIKTADDDSLPILQSNSFMARAEKVIDDHISDADFNSSAFAKEMAVSRAQLFRHFKEYGKSTVSGLITERRMKLATRLLLTTNRTLSDIAEAVGYSDASNFRRAFMRHFGMTPSQYKESVISSHKTQQEQKDGESE